MNNTYVAIMAGGIGSRFWPGSRVARPKQFLDILGIGKSLIRMTFERSLKLCPKENIFIVTNTMYKGLVKEHLPEITDNQILCEPSRNNTAPCVAYTAFKLHNLNANANVIICPSDHIILDEAEYVRVVNQAINFGIKHQALLTLGIQPTSPNTGYGYINYAKTAEDGVHKVAKFTEKPNIENAKKFLASGDYLWNAGIFVCNVAAMLKAFQTYAGEIFTILEKGQNVYNTSEEQPFIDEAYPTTPSISIDYAIMEKATNVYTIPSSFGWSDLGTWASLHEEFEKDENNNACNSDNILTFNTTNSLIRAAKDKLVVVNGLDDYIIVDEADVLLIYPKSKEQEIKKITKTISGIKGDKYL